MAMLRRITRCETGIAITISCAVVPRIDSLWWSRSVSEATNAENNINEWLKRLTNIKIYQVY